MHHDALRAELQHLGRRDARDGQIVRALEAAHGNRGALVVEARERPVVGAEGLEAALELHHVVAAGAERQDACGAQLLGRVDRERPSRRRSRCCRHRRWPRSRACGPPARGAGAAARSGPRSQPRRAARCRRDRAARPRCRRAAPGRSPATNRRSSRAASGAPCRGRPARGRRAGAAPSRSTAKVRVMTERLPARSLAISSRSCGHQAAWGRDRRRRWAGA